MISAMPNTGLAIELQPAERTQLNSGSPHTERLNKLALRCRIILYSCGASGCASWASGGLGDRSRSRAQSAL